MGHYIEREIGEGERREEKKWYTMYFSKVKKAKKIDQEKRVSITKANVDSPVSRKKE